MKSSIKLSRTEARIIVYLIHTSGHNRTGTMISGKLRIDYAHALRLLRRMTEIGWLTQQSFTVKKYYYLSKNAPIDEAKKVLR